MMFVNTFLIIIALLTWDDVYASRRRNGLSSHDNNDRYHASLWWNGWSPHDNNDRYQREPLPVTLAVTKTEFKQLWYTILNGPIQTNPTVYEDRVYVPTIAGTFYCLHADSGIIMWQRNLSAIMNNGHVYISRTSPLVYKDMIILGIMEGLAFQKVVGHGSYVIALNRFTGALRWQTLVSSHPASTITDTPQLANDRLFIGISSSEESFSASPTYPCCTFQGSVVALKASTGKFIWETKMLPDNKGTTTGYSGAGVWGSQFPVDYKRNQIYIGTGNYYKLPPLVQQCLDETTNLTLYSDPCNQPGVYGQAILALDMSTGIIRWSRTLASIEAWTVACLFPDSVPNPNCPSKPGLDFDFGQAPILKLNLKYKFGGNNRDQLFVGQKSGIAYDFDAETGTLIWSNQVSPGSYAGGMEFGSAADDQYLYVGNNNVEGLRYTLPDGTTTTKASWSALDLVTGDIKWTTVDPTTDITQTSAYFALTIWDQLVLVQGGTLPYSTSNPIKGCLYGLNKKNGKILYEKCIQNTPLGTGASVAKNTIYVGVGYNISRVATDGILALQLPS
ncbi:unnamed protein product [Rotaria sp. Silwood2]|nr:unnamed protein product [Rotaria sp. Silwood2]CAF4380945.1 unnamed protein product [Rotaria sp. Silwood2]